MTLFRNPILTVQILVILLGRLLKGTVKFMLKHFIIIAILVALGAAF